MQLLHKWAPTYISLIKKYPKGIPNRLQHFDRWVGTWQEPHIHSYYDYFMNGEKKEHPMWIPDCAKSNAAYDQAMYGHRPGIAQMEKNFVPFTTLFANDHQLSQDIREKTLKDFLAGSLKSQTRTDQQRLAFWGSTMCISIILYFYFFILNADDQQTIVQLQPDPSYFHYQASYIRHLIKATIEKINFLQQHSRQQLSKAQLQSKTRRSSPTPKFES